MIIEYKLIIKYVVLCFLISMLLIILSYLIINQKTNSEKISIYECGFNPFSDSRGKFEIKFYIVAILFIIFDLEIVFLFPWVLVMHMMSLLGFIIMMFFLYILLVGFFYEWSKGVLDWN